MRHNKKFNHLGRTAAHRKALLSNLSAALIMEKRIFTTLAKAKALRKHIEPIITRSKTDSGHNRRTVFSRLQNAEAVTELFEIVADRVKERPGGYIRIIRTGYRKGDNAEMCMIELVDFNEVYVKEQKSKDTPKKRRKRKKSTSKTASKTTATASSEEIQSEDVQVEDSTSEEDIEKEEKT